MLCIHTANADDVFSRNLLVMYNMYKEVNRNVYGHVGQTVQKSFDAIVKKLNYS